MWSDEEITIVCCFNVLLLVVLGNETDLWVFGSVKDFIIDKLPFCCL